MADDMMAWLKAQILETKTLAEAIQAGEAEVQIITPGRDDSGHLSDADIDAVGNVVGAVSPREWIARADAELAILDLYEQQSAKAGENAMEEDRAWTLRPVVSLLAAGYKHREGWQERWGA